MDENPQHDESHPHSEKQINTDDQKLTTAIAAVTSPKFPLPTLDANANVLRYALSFGTLILLLGAGLVGTWMLEIEILQSSQPVLVMGVFGAVVLAALFLTGTVWIDWYELVLGYWWLSMPVGALAGLMLVMNQEKSAGLHESD